MTDATDTEACLALLKQGDFDRYLTCLFSPPEHRSALAALFAFNREIVRTPALVSEPMIGEIRLQWWRDVLNGERQEEANAHPVAAPLMNTLARYSLPVRALLDLIDARVFDLYHDLMPTENDVEAYCGETTSSLFRLASIILSKGKEIASADVSGHAGVAVGLTSILRALPWHAARGQIFLSVERMDRFGVKAEGIRARQASPELLTALADLRNKIRYHLSEAETALLATPDSLKPAFLSLATVVPQLRQMDDRDYNPFITPIIPSRLASLYRYWRRARMIKA